MKRRHWIEISDEPWCPRGIRNAVTDYSRFVTELSGIYNAVAPLLIDALKRTGGRLVLDLGSGAAGPWLRLQPLLRKLGMDVTVCLSDHNPDIVAFERAGRLPGTPSCIMPNRWMQRTFPAGCPASERCFRLSIISIQARPAPRWRTQWRTGRASQYLRAASAVC
jgi:hypothetical protein